MSVRTMYADAHTLGVDEVIRLTHTVKSTLIRTELKIVGVSTVSVAVAGTLAGNGVARYCC